jgi:hypothetical protein
MAVYLTRSDTKSFQMCCLNNAVDEIDDDMLRNGSEEDGNVSSESEEDEGTACEDGESDTLTELHGI